MQQGPTPEEIKEKIKAFQEQIQAESFEGFTDLNDKIGFVRVLAGTAGVQLNNKQIEMILQQQSASVDEIMKLQTKPVNPNMQLAVQITMALAVATKFPGLTTAALSNIALRNMLHSLFDNQLGAYHKAIDLALAAVELGLGEYSVRGLSSHLIEQLTQTYGAYTYLAIPAAMILYNKGPAMLAAIQDSETLETAGDFFDIMHGMADDEVSEKYKGSLTTMSIEDVVSRVMDGVGSTLSWVWSKSPSLRSPKSTPMPKTTLAVPTSSPTPF